MGTFDDLNDYGQYDDGLDPSVLGRESLGEMGNSGGYNYTHAMMPRRGAAISRRLITTIGQALDYAAAGFHVCVDQANREPAGSNHHMAWQAAADDYYKASKQSTVQEMVRFLERADASAEHAGSARLTRTAPPKSGSTAIAVVNRNSPVPVPEQLVKQLPSPGIMSMQIAGLPVWALALPLGYLVYRKWSQGRSGSASAPISNPGRRPRRRRRRRR